jgi:hypothetical protein
MKPINSFIFQYKKYILESQTILDYLVIAWAHLLGALAITGVGRIVYELITKPSTFSNATWGIFDTLG